MPSEAQIEANRRNAKRSTGPRSSEGKARSAQNARKHGLAAPVPISSADPIVGQEAQRLARALTGLWGTEIAQHAVRVAQLTVQLELIRAAKHQTWEQHVAAEPAELLDKLRRLDRYETRATAAHARAVRAFDQSRA